MNLSVFHSLQALFHLLGKWDYSIIEEEPGGRNKHNKIFGGLNNLFVAQRIHMRTGMSALETEILTFGPKMAHDDTIETLYYANCHAYAPSQRRIEAPRHGAWRQKKRSWVTA